MKALVVQIKHIGDAVVSGLILTGLKRHDAEIETHYMVISSAKQAVLHNQDIDSFFLVDAGKLMSLSYVWNLIRQVREERYDLVLDVYGKPIGNLLSFFSKAKTRVGYAKKRSAWIYTHHVDPENAQLTAEPHSVRDRKLFLDAIDVDSSCLSPAIELTREELDKAEKRIRKAGLEPRSKLFMVGILGSGETKSYPASYMAHLLDEVVEKEPNITLLVNYIPSQLQQVESILALTREETRARVNLDLYADGLRDFLALLKQCSGLFGNEGGAVNMAKALGVPTFAIYSPQIKLNAWSGVEEREALHPSAHLIMYRPELLPVKKSDTFRQAELYKLFEPHLFLKNLLEFVRKN